MTKDLHTPDNQSLIDFPCDYKLKAMGKNSDTFIDVVFEITKKFAPDITKENITLNNSKKKNFISVNIQFHATCIEQIHGIYGELKKHPEVLMTL
jgi:putative lipoic acid-binding regulatory protein